MTGVRVCVCARVRVRGGASGVGARRGLARPEAGLMYRSERERMRSEELVARWWRDGGFREGAFPHPGSLAAWMQRPFHF